MDSPKSARLDAETKALESPQDHKNELRLWLRLLTCTNLAEALISRRLREQFDITLPRFDLAAQLERAPQGMTLSELSKRMMVSNGNTTGLVDRMVECGWVCRTSLPGDRRVQIVALTQMGRAKFAVMAAAHETWIAEMFQGLSDNDTETLMRLLRDLKLSLNRSAT